MKLSALIVDDDDMSLKVLSRLVRENENLELVGTAKSGQEAMDTLKHTAVDLIFLDIVMPNMSGLEFIDYLEVNPYIILTTSHKEYALDAFEHGVSDYLVKPVQQQRFNKAITKVLEKYHSEKGVSLNYEEYVLNKAFRFLYSRGKETLHPVPDRNSQFGYAFPMLSIHYEQENAYRIPDVLEMAENEGLLWGQFFETIYLCPQCYEGFVHYREVCPKCNSSNLFSEELIHHFPCAYIGPISDFTTESDARLLICPKCDHTLKHIGVDYDKPSMIYTCNNCDHRFQDVFVQAKCLTCGTDSAVEHLAKRTLKKYELTNKGIEAAKSGTGFLSQNEVKEKIPGTVDMETFNLMLQYEIKRKEVAGIQANIAYIHLVKRKTLLKDLDYGQRRDFFARVVETIQNHISNLDIIAFKDQSTLLFSINDQSYEQGDELIRTIIRALKTDLGQEFEPLKPEFSFNIMPINKEMDYQSQLGELLNNANSE